MENSSSSDNISKDVQRHATITDQETEDSSKLMKNQAVFLNQKGQSQARLPTVASGPLKCADGDIDDSTIAGVTRPQQDSEPPAPGKGSGSPDTSTSALVLPGTGYLDDDQLPVSKQWVRNELQQMSAKHKEEMSDLEKKFQVQIESVRKENQQKTKLLEQKEEELSSCKAKIKELKGKLESETKEKQDLKEKLDEEEAIRTKLEKEVEDLKETLAEAEKKVEDLSKTLTKTEKRADAGKEILEKLKRIESNQQNLSTAQKRNHKDQMNAHMQTRQSVTEAAKPSLLKADDVQEKLDSSSTSGPTFYLASSYGPSVASSADTVSTVEDNDHIATKHRFEPVEHHSFESSVDPNN